MIHHFCFLHSSTNYSNSGPYILKEQVCIVHFILYVDFAVAWTSATHGYLYWCIIYWKYSYSDERWESELCGYNEFSLEFWLIWCIFREVIVLGFHLGSMVYLLIRSWLYNGVRYGFYNLQWDSGTYMQIINWLVSAWLFHYWNCLYLPKTVIIIVLSVHTWVSFMISFSSSSMQSTFHFYDS